MPAPPVVFALVVGVALTYAVWYFMSTGGSGSYQAQHYSTRPMARGRSQYDSTCTICYDDVNIGSRILKCGHSFHARCIEVWLQENLTCPNCRMSS